MESESARLANARPFYASRASAYDALISAPVQPWVDAVSDVRSSGSLLDAGCGTGRHAEAFVRAGFQVEMLDASKSLLAIARERCPTLPAHLADICTLELGHAFDLVTCRGVLNDLVPDGDRAAALDRLAAHVARGGFLILDVRERDASRVRSGQTTSREARLPGGETVRFTSSTHWEEPLLIVEEMHVTAREGMTTEVEHNRFEMRPWTEIEIRDGIRSAGLSDVDIHPGVGRATGDRLFVVATRHCSSQ